MEVGYLNQKLFHFLDYILKNKKELEEDLILDCSEDEKHIYFYHIVINTIKEYIDLKEHGESLETLLDQNIVLKHCERTEKLPIIYYSTERMLQAFNCLKRKITPDEHEAILVEASSVL